MKPILTSLLLIFYFMGYGQSKTDTTHLIKGRLYDDTIVVSQDIIIILDSATYSQLTSMIGSIPPSINKQSGYILNAIDGSRKNVFMQPHYAVKPKNKK